MAVVVKYGRLRHVVGRAARHDGFVFVPVWFSFDSEPTSGASPGLGDVPEASGSDFAEVPMDSSSGISGLSTIPAPVISITPRKRTAFSK